MKSYLILKSFTGSQNGIDSESFVAGTTRHLSDSLVAALGGPAGGVIKPAEQAAAEIAKAPHALAEAVLESIEDAETPPDPNARETKVTGPEETKPAKPLTKMSKAELVTHALTAHGLELVPDTMTVKEMIAAIEAAGNH